MNRLAVVGDIHGHSDPLRRLITEVRSSVDTFVFVGDYVNRGPNSANVIDVLIELAQCQRCVFLEGNHDAAMRASLRGKFDEFLSLGGAATIRSYISPPFVDVEREFLAAVPLAHIEFLDSLVPQFETGDVIVEHKLPEADGSHRFRIGGHTPERSTAAIVGTDFACVDTGCGTLDDGELSCVLWPSLESRSVRV